jgi:broad specificity phosphatase PhoE
LNSAQATRILAIRHGETLWNVDSRIQGHLDIGLNDTGRWQAERLGMALKDEPMAALLAEKWAARMAALKAATRVCWMAVQTADQTAASAAASMVQPMADWKDNKRAAGSAVWTVARSEALLAALAADGLVAWWDVT